MHRGDDKSCDVLGDETEWKVSSREPDRKETNTSKGDHKERGWKAIEVIWLHVGFSSGFL